MSADLQEHDPIAARAALPVHGSPLYIRMTPSSSDTVNVVPDAFHCSGVNNRLARRARRVNEVVRVAYHAEHQAARAARGGKKASSWETTSPLTSTIPILAPFPKSATTSALHGSPSSPGSTRQIRTTPSREPVAMRWCDRPHDGAHAREVSGEEGPGGVRWRREVGVGSREMICQCVSGLHKATGVFPRPTALRDYQ